MPSWKRIARPIQGAVARLRPEQNAEYEAAVKEFLLDAVALEDADGPAPALAIEPAPEPVDATPASEPEGATLAVVPAVEPAPALSPSGQAAPPPSPNETPAWLPEATPQEGPALRRRRRAGETAPDHLLRAPGSVDLSTDRFLDGLVRRIEGDR